jgi:Spy/CpxP family protein refolding chaperone
MMGGVFRQLDLTDEQREQVRTKIEAHMEGALGEYMRQQDEIRQELQRLIHDPAADENAVADAARRVSDYCERVAVERHRMVVDLFEVLDEEQRQQATELLNELPDRSQKFRQRRHLAPGAE